MPLPLVARKSLRDNEEKLQEAVESIKNSLGVEWTFEFDFEAIIAKTTDDYIKNDLGGMFYKTLALEGVAELIADVAKDEISKEGIIEANSQAKVIMRINEDKKDSSYFRYIFENGALVLLFRMPMANVTDARYFDIKKVIPSPGVYSLKARINLKDNQEKFTEALERIKAVTKEDWSYCEEALEKVYVILDDKDRVGDLFSEIIGYVADNIEKRCKDDMVLEAFNEVTTGHKIIFRQNLKGNGWVWSFESGNLVITFRSISNIHENSYFDFEKLL